jgi:hypothetical protein
MWVEFTVQLCHNRHEGDIASSNAERLVARTRRGVPLAFNPPKDTAQ